MTSHNYYRTLEVNYQASQQEIKQAYRRLVKQFHPDSQTQGASHDKIIEINAAYEILGDPQRRQAYDYHFNDGAIPTGVRGRQERTAEAQASYQRYREAQRDTEFYIDRWYNKIYLPINRSISQIIRPLERQIDQLSADPFDDRLMAGFQTYIETCRQQLEQARQIFSSQPNPAKLAKVAAHLYHCLNHISDGIEELEFFTLNYDEHSLHTGQELFYLAYRLQGEAKEVALKYR